MLFLFRALFKSLTSKLEHLYNFILPQRCIICKDIIDASGEFCYKCWSDLDFVSDPFCYICGSKFDYQISKNMLCGECIINSPLFNKARHLLSYDDKTRFLIHELKFSDKTYLAKIFAKLLFSRYKKEISDYDVIIPVPMHWLKRFLRMYNQSSLIALYLSRISQKEYCYGLIKNKWTKAQSSLTYKQRVKNLHGSIKKQKNFEVKGKKIVLVDDVYTSGATIKECCKILKHHGAQEIFVLTVAKTLKI